jgi:hypothetical protein
MDVMLTCVRWYVAYPLSLRHLEEMMAERGVAVDHATVHRWAIKIVPVLALVFRRRKRCVGTSWRMDETYILVHGHWKYLYRAVDRAGDTIDLLLTAKRDKAAARLFLDRAIALKAEPAKITSTRAVPTPLPLKVTMPIMAPTSSYVSASTSTTSLSKIIGPLNASYDRCSDSKCFVALAFSLPESRPYI